MPEAVTNDRVRRFFPLGVARPRVLSAAQIRQFNELGYLFPLPVFGAQEVVELRAYFDDLFARAVAAGYDSYAITAGTVTVPGCTTCAPRGGSWIWSRTCSVRT